MFQLGVGAAIFQPAIMAEKRLGTALSPHPTEKE
jgi:hypothetical protein